MFRTDFKKFYNLLRQKNANVKNAPNKEEIQNTWKAYRGKMFNTMMKPKDQKPIQQNPGKEWRPIFEKGGGNGTKNNAQLKSSWKRSNRKFLAYATHIKT